MLQTSKLAENHEELLALKKEVEQLRRAVKDHESLFHGKEKLADIASQLKNSDAQVKSLQQQVEQHKRMEAKLLSEVEQIGTAWTHLEDQNSRKVLDLTTKEDLIQQLLAEKTKLDQKCAVLTKQGNTFNNMAVALKKQSDKQLEQIRRLEEFHKQLQEQLANNDKELAARSVSIETHKQKAMSANAAYMEVHQKFEQFKQDTMSQTTMFRERAAKVEELERKNRALEEEVSTVNQKLKFAAAGGSDDKALKEYQVCLTT
jgi:chromosome segregation ATPase